MGQKDREEPLIHDHSGWEGFMVGGVFRIENFLFSRLPAFFEGMAPIAPFSQDFECSWQEHWGNKRAVTDKAVPRLKSEI